MRMRIVILGGALAVVTAANMSAHGQIVTGTKYCISSSFKNSADIIYLVNYLYTRGPVPEPVAYAGNIDCKGGVDLADVVHLVNFVFRGGPIPCGFCGYYRDPAETEDAETIAMYLGDDVYAPAEQIARVQNDLQRIRPHGVDDQTPLSSLYFITPWTEGSITLHVDNNTFVAMRERTYHAWDSLNARYSPKVIDLYISCGRDCDYCAFLYFEGIANCEVAAKLYGALPGVISAYSHLRISIGFEPVNRIFPMRRGDTITYLFYTHFTGFGTHSYGHFWYFAALPDTAWFIGYWDSGEGAINNPNAPEWWPQAEENIELYRGW